MVEAIKSLKIKPEIEPGELILCLRGCQLFNNDSVAEKVLTVVDMGDALLHLDKRILAKGIFRDKEEIEYLWLHLMSLKKVYCSEVHVDGFFCLMPQET